MPSLTHFAPYDQPRHARIALCGAPVTPREEAVVPTCPACAQALREDEAAIHALRTERKAASEAGRRLDARRRRAAEQADDL